ncbi:MAG: hypothetical protein JKY54_12285, partial [Flavobacteriales bacterium]|nr:hypothetical protein [Flavobacteriales bacterium]
SPTSTTLYTATVTDNCGITASNSITITVNQPPNPGLDALLSVCDSDPTISLLGALGGTPAGGGSWSGPSGLSGGSSGNFNPSNDVSGVYTYMLNGSAPCLNQTATVTVTVNPTPDAGTPGAITVCDNGANINLFSSLGGSPDNTGAWTGPSGLSGGNLGTFNPGTSNAGVYTYTVMGLAPCLNASATVTVTVNPMPDAGTLGTITLCDNSASVNLFASLGGTPDNGGSWSGPSSLTGGDLGTFTPGTSNSGVYTYTVIGTAPCTNSATTVTVTINPQPVSGTIGATTVCDNGPNINLFTFLGGLPDNGGTWSGPSALAGGDQGTFTPGSSSAGAYTYTVTGVAPCTNAFTTVTVTVNPMPDAGTPGTITLCDNSTSVNLFTSLGGTPDNGGSWSGPSVLAGGDLGTFTPGTSSSGVYTYTVTGTAPCINATTTVTVTINPQPIAGTVGTTTVCDNGPAINLFSFLGGSPDNGGTWSGPSALGGGDQGTFTPGSSSAGAYTYTVTGVAPCTNAFTTVTVTVNPMPDAGTPGAITFCDNSASSNLFSSLTGTPDGGGTWSPALSSGTGIFDPAVDAPGIYTYTVTGIAPCVNATANVTVTVNPQADAGLPGTITLCINSTSINLFSSLLGAPDAGGSWSPILTSGTGVFDPATDAAGIYTYTITGVAPCLDATATITVTINPIPDAGTGSPLVLCDNSPTSDLFASLGGTPDIGGIWSPVLSSGTGVFDPAVDAPGAYTYTVTGTAPCTNATAIITVTINTSPDPGISGAITFCSLDPLTNLFASLGGTPDVGGVWTPVLASGTGVFDPAVDAAGLYTYTLTGIAPCVNVASTVTVTLNNNPDAGTLGAITLCNNGGLVNLYSSLGGTPDIGGAWSGASGLAGGDLGTFDPTSNLAGTYTYTIVGGGTCPTVTADVVVTLNNQADAGTNGTITLCNNGAVVDLFNSLTGIPAIGGLWSPALTSGTGVFDPSVDAAGTYTYTITGILPCIDATADVAVTVNPQPDAGTPGSITLCTNSPAIDLFNSLGGSPDTGGSWSPVLTSGTGIFDPAIDAAGTYTYTATGIVPCVNVTADIVVTVNPMPDAGTLGTITVCSNAAATDLFASLGGTPNISGTWTPVLTSGTGFFDPAIDAPGTYTYTVTGTAPCINSTADVVVTVNSQPDAGIPGAITFCDSDPITDLFASLGGTPGIGGSWAPALASGTGMFDPLTDPAGVYTYTLIGTSPCVNASTIVTVTLNNNPDAGLPGTITVCDNGASVNLFASLNGTPDNGGIWSGPSALVGGDLGTLDPATNVAGTYTYTIVGGGTCPTVMADVVVSINSQPDAGVNSLTTICNNGGTINLFSILGGTPQVGGFWSPGLTSGTDVFDPSLDAAGTYTYTLTGIAPCINATADVVVTINSQPDPGLNGAITLCDNGGTVDLFASLLGTPDIGGTWSPALLSGTGVFDPAIDLSNTYSYTLIGTAPCLNVSADVVVSINTQPTAGLPGVITTCNNAAPIDLFASLGGLPDAGGTWVPALTSGTGVFDPAIEAAGTYTYTLSGTAPCLNATADIVVTVNAQPDAGTPGAITFCDSDPITDLFASLGGTPDVGGLWSPALVSGTGMFDPLADVAGVYTYTTLGTAPCLDASSTVTVTLNNNPDAGTNGAISVCNHGALVDLFTLLGGTPNNGGIWTGPSALLGGDLGTFDPSSNTGGTYTYTIIGGGTCPTVTADVIITVNLQLDAGISGIITICNNGGTIDLFGILGGTPDPGGIWSPALASGIGILDPAIDAAGAYTYTLIGTTPCQNATANVVVTINPAPNAGINGAITFCSDDGPQNLFNSLGGLPDAGGTWSPALASLTGSFDPLVDPSGVYSYFVDGGAPCL